jgi:hypothetical protein
MIATLVAKQEFLKIKTLTRSFLPLPSLICPAFFPTGEISPKNETKKIIIKKVILEGFQSPKVKGGEGGGGGDLNFKIKKNQSKKKSPDSYIWFSKLSSQKINT